MTERLRFLRIKSPPTKLFFKCFYVFCISYSAYFIASNYYSEGYVNRFYIFTYLCFGLFSLFGMVFNFMNMVFAEKNLSYWSSLFMGLVVLNQTKLILFNDFYYSANCLFMQILLFMVTFYRFFYLRNEIKETLNLRKAREEFLNGKL